MFGFGRKTPRYKSDGTDEDIFLDGSGKVSNGGRRLWRFAGRGSASKVGDEVEIGGRRARIVESSDGNGYVEFL